VWQEYILDVSDQAFAADTSVGFLVDGKTYGFPLAIEGYGIGYNAELLEKAGIDPTTLTTLTAFTEACEKLAGLKDELGIEVPVAMAASTSGGMWWVAAQHNFNTYWTGNLPYGDMTYVEKTLNGEVDKDRLTQYAKFLKVLFDYADQDVLLNGNYDAQVNLFATQKAVFIQQGNWIDPNIKTLGVNFKMGYIAEVFTDEPTTGLMVAAPSWYVVNSQSAHADEALKFLNDMVFTDAGQNYMVKEAGMVPAFASVTLKPEGQLSVAIQDAAAKGDIFSWGFGYLPDGFTMNQLGPVFELFAQKVLDVPAFVDMVAEAIAGIPGLNQ
jgi:raffinose/stachyose/melibiose transport system substrate-binding protein